MQINLSGDVRDAYDIIDGVFTDSDFIGRRTTSELGDPTELVGTVRGSCIQ